MKRRLESFLLWSTSHPRTAVAGHVLVTLVMGYLASGIEADFTIENLFPRDDPGVEDYFRFRKEFEREDDLVYIAYRSPDPFSYDNLRTTSELTRSFESIAGIGEVISLTNVVLFEPGEELAATPVLNPLPDDSLTLEGIRTRILSTPLLTENLVSSDGKVAAFILSIQDEYNRHDRRARILGEIHHTLETVPWRWHLAGIPVLRTEYVLTMLDDFFRFIGPVVAVVVGVLFILFRTWQGVLLPLVTVIMVVIWITGIMALFGITVNIVSYIVPTLIILVGVADAIHILVKYHEEFDRTRDKSRAMEDTLRRIGAAIFLTSFTTAVGFLSLTTTNIVIVRQFGAMVAAGVVLAFVSTVTFLPAMLTLLRPPSEGILARSRRSVRHRFIQWVVKATNRYPLVIVSLSFGTVVAFSLLAMRVDPHSSLMEDLKKGTRLYDDLVFMERTMGGVLPLEVLVTPRGEGKTIPGSVKDPQVLSQIANLQAFLETIPEIGKAVSLVDYVRELNRAFHGGLPEYYELPGSRQGVSQLLLLSGGRADFLANRDYSTARVSARIVDVTSKRAAEISEEIREWSRRNLGESIEVRLTGTTLMALKTNQYLVKNLVVSFLVAFAVILVAMGLLFRSFRVALISMVPNVIPILVMGGVMGLTHIKLRPTTAMTFAIAFGIAVDDTIHYLARFRQELAAAHGRYQAANERTLFTTGKAIVSTSMILVLGFLVLVVSSFIPTRDFGFLAAVTLAGALVGDLFFLPSVLSLVRPSIPRVAGPGGHH